MSQEEGLLRAENRLPGFPGCGPQDPHAVAGKESRRPRCADHAQIGLTSLQVQGSVAKGVPGVEYDSFDEPLPPHRKAPDLGKSERGEGHTHDYDQGIASAERELCVIEVEDRERIAEESAVHFDSQAADGHVVHHEDPVGVCNSTAGEALRSCHEEPNLQSLHPNIRGVEDFVSVLIQVYQPDDRPLRIDEQDAPCQVGIAAA